jgi:sulfur-oxidizing protein SoxY
MSNFTSVSAQVSRRKFLKCAGAGAAVISLVPMMAHASPQTVRDNLAKLIGKQDIPEGPVHITLPEIAENGSVVALTVAVDSPMTKEDHVKAIHILADGNPLPDVATYRLNPINGEAKVSLRIRLAKTQNIICAAETSKGEAFMSKQMVKVTLGGCGG